MTNYHGIDDPEYQEHVQSSHDWEYLDLVRRVLNDGVKKGDRTGTGTTSLPFQQMRFDLRGGSIPLLTTKKMFTRGVIYELLWYLEGNTSSKELERNNVNIWKEWSDEDGYLGPIYGEMWRAFPPPDGYFPIPKREITDDTSIKSFITGIPPNTPAGKYTGETFTNIQGLRYTVYHIDGTQPNGRKGNTTSTYTIRFENSGWVKPHVSTRGIRTGKFLDQSLPSVCGVGILGDYANKHETEINKRLRRVWEQMISRCYNNNDVQYHNYGGKGIKVCNRWLVLSDFIEDAKTLPNWHQAKNHKGYELDKEYFGYNKIYHPDSCAWVRKTHNNQNKPTNTPIVLSNSQTRKFFPSLRSASAFLGVSQTPLSHRLRHNLNTPINGFKVNEFKDNNYVIRPLPVFDQIANVIHQLRTNPNDRRMIVNSWHPSLTPSLYVDVSPDNRASLGYQSLPPCHTMFQFWTGGENDLRCHLYQRSCDVGLGVPFNIVQYSILTHMVAQVTGFEATEFVWTGGDVHIYNNHQSQLLEQICRDPYPSPTLKLNPEVKEIDDFKYEDFEIVGYQHHPTIKMEVSV